MCSPITSNNCLFANSLGQCLQCASGYVLIQYICYSQIPFCANYSTNSYSCLYCLSGYYLYNNYCVNYPNGCLSVNSQGNCNQCAQGYTLLSNGLCQLNINANCTQYDPVSGKCLACRAGFYLDTGNNCQVLPNNCQTALSSGSCSQCISGYSLQNGICYQMVPNCNQYSQGFCINCASSYYLFNNLCYPYPNYCSVFNTTIN